MTRSKLMRQAVAGAVAAIAKHHARPRPTDRPASTAADGFAKSAELEWRGNADRLRRQVKGR